MSEASKSTPEPDFLPFCRPSIDASDVEAVCETLRSGWITTGARCAELEQGIADRVGAAAAVAVTSGTAALHLMLLAMEIGPGDEVITPSMTWISTPNVIQLVGATPVFVEVDRDTLLVSADAIRRAITPRTRAIIPVHYAGAPCDLDSIRQVAEEAEIPLIQDAAHAIGTQYRDEEIGCSGHAIFSLHPIKNVTTGEGGVLVTEDIDLAQRVRQLRFHGLGAEAWDRNQQGRSPHVEVQFPGLKYNLPDMNATLGVSQLQRLDHFIRRRQEIVERYRSGLPSGILPLADPTWSHRHARHLFIVRVLEDQVGINRDRFMEALKEHGIGTGIHFRAAHLHRWYRSSLPVPEGVLTDTEWNSERICSLPLFPDMTDADVDRVLSAIRSVVQTQGVPQGVST